MKDILIPLGLVSFLCFFVYVFIRTARKQRDAKACVFEDFATRFKLFYQKTDDGKVQSFALDFDGIGRFKSPSLGKILPENVVSGNINGLQIILFRHRIRFSDGWAREWFVAGVKRQYPIAKRCSIQFCKQQTDKDTMYLQDPIVKEFETSSFLMIVRAPSLPSAGILSDDDILKKLAKVAEKIPFRPEIQVRGNRIVAYLADRNEIIENVENLESLMKISQKVAGI